MWFDNQIHFRRHGNTASIIFLLPTLTNKTDVEKKRAISPLETVVLNHFSRQSSACNFFCVCCSNCYHHHTQPLKLFNSNGICNFCVCNICKPTNTIMISLRFIFILLFFRLCCLHSASRKSGDAFNQIRLFDRIRAVSKQ